MTIMTDKKAKITKIPGGAIVLLMLSLFLAFTAPLSAAESAYPFPVNGVIQGTDVEYSNLELTKSGVSVTLTNRSPGVVRISSQMLFLDKNATKIAGSIFALRDLEPGASINIDSNYLDGSWKKAKKETFRLEWKPMTYEHIY